MSEQNELIYCNDEQFTELDKNGSVDVNGVTEHYKEGNLYVTEDGESGGNGGIYLHTVTLKTTNGSSYPVLMFDTNGAQFMTGSLEVNSAVAQDFGDRMSSVIAMRVNGMLCCNIYGNSSYGFYFAYSTGNSSTTEELSSVESDTVIKI